MAAPSPGIRSPFQTTQNISSLYLSLVFSYKYVFPQVVSILVISTVMLKKSEQRAILKCSLLHCFSANQWPNFINYVFTMFLQIRVFLYLELWSWKIIVIFILILGSPFPKPYGILPKWSVVHATFFCLKSFNDSRMPTRCKLFNIILYKMIHYMVLYVSYIIHIIYSSYIFQNLPPTTHYIDIQPYWITFTSLRCSL